VWNNGVKQKKTISLYIGNDFMAISEFASAIAALGDDAHKKAFLDLKEGSKAIVKGYMAYVADKKEKKGIIKSFGDWGKDEGKTLMDAAKSDEERKAATAFIEEDAAVAKTKKDLFKNGPEAYADAGNPISNNMFAMIGGALALLAGYLFDLPLVTMGLAAVGAVLAGSYFGDSSNGFLSSFTSPATPAKKPDGPGLADAIPLVDKVPVQTIDTTATLLLNGKKMLADKDGNPDVSAAAVAQSNAKLIGKWVDGGLAVSGITFEDGGKTYTETFTPPKNLQADAEKKELNFEKLVPDINRIKDAAKLQYSARIEKMEKNPEIKAELTGKTIIIDDVEYPELKIVYKGVFNEEPGTRTFIGAWDKENAKALLILGHKKNDIKGKEGELESFSLGDKGIKIDAKIFGDDGKFIEGSLDKRNMGPAVEKARTKGVNFAGYLASSPGATPAGKPLEDRAAGMSVG
jgi:hypothetical protein